MKVLYLIRHGQAAGPGDQPLSKKGIKQANALKEIIPEFDFVLSSQLQRATHTAQILFGQAVTTDSLYNEIYREVIGGPSKPDSQQRFVEDSKRAKQAYESLINLQGDAVALVCHGNLIRYFVSQVLGCEPNNMWSTLDIPPTGVVILVKDGDSLRLRFPNSLKLDTDLIKYW